MNRLLLIFLSAFFLLVSSCIGQEKFPISQIDPGLENSDHPKIVVFMPSISDSTEYASMVVQAFKNYFVQKLAFNPEDRSLANVDIILIKASNELKYEAVYKDANNIQLTFLINTDNKQDVFNNLFHTAGMYISNANEGLLSKLNIPQFDNYNNSSVLFLLDKENNVVWRDYDYRGQGEHLKPLEYKVKQLLDISYPKPVGSEKELEVGDMAPDIVAKGDFGGEMKVLTFYPAAYSGVFDVNNIARRISMERFSLISCAMHISSLDRIPLNNYGVAYYAISESTPELLNNWKASLGTHHIQYINDPDYSISEAFGAYNSNGYCNRVAVVIDKNGKIAYLNKDYKLDKEEEVKKVIERLQAK